VNFILRKHCSLDQPHLQCSTTTRGSWLPERAAKVRLFDKRPNRAPSPEGHSDLPADRGQRLALAKSREHSRGGQAAILAPEIPPRLPSRRRGPLLVKYMSHLPLRVSALPLGMVPMTHQSSRGQSRSLSSATGASTYPLCPRPLSYNGEGGQTGLLVVKNNDRIILSSSPSHLLITPHQYWELFFSTP